jgi:hypothetical protein
VCVLQLLDGLQVRDHIMVAIMNASSVELRSSLLQVRRNGALILHLSSEIFSRDKSPY